MGTGLALHGKDGVCREFPLTHAVSRCKIPLPPATQPQSEETMMLTVHVSVRIPADLYVRAQRYTVPGEAHGHPLFDTFGDLVVRAMANELDRIEAGDSARDPRRKVKQKPAQGTPGGNGETPCDGSTVPA